LIVTCHIPQYMNNATEKYQLKKYMTLNEYIMQLMMHIFLSQSALCMVMQQGS
jgi:hypothetical protein